jgi:hypothetical protein
MNLSSPMLAGLDAADAPPSDAPSADGGQESAKTETETTAATDEPVAEATK